MDSASDGLLQCVETCQHVPSLLQGLPDENSLHDRRMRSPTCLWPPGSSLLATLQYYDGGLVRTSVGPPCYQP